MRAGSLLTRMEARALRLLHGVMDNSSLPTLPAKPLAARSCVEAALPAAHRAAICHDDIIRHCCTLGLLDVGVSTDGAMWFWLTPAGDDLCTLQFGRL